VRRFDFSLCGRAGNNSDGNGGGPDVTNGDAAKMRPQKNRQEHTQGERKKSSCVRKFLENSSRHPIINNRPLGLAVDEKSIIRWICDKNGMKIHGVFKTERKKKKS
jgi:hypothetical protein